MTQVFNMDCMIAMKEFPDKFFELAIVDPPYGLDMSQELYKRGQSCQANGYKDHKDKDWDKNVPDNNYFQELFRVSKEQIICGGNYFNLPVSPCWIVWDKVNQGFSFAEGELLWSSFKTSLKIFKYARGNDSGFAPKLKDHFRAGINIHPTQKPVALYKWLLKNYAKEGDKILDTHGGSMSIRIAADQMGFDFWGYELDKDYFDASVKRFNQYKSQLTMFQP